VVFGENSEIRESKHLLLHLVVCDFCPLDPEMSVTKHVLPTKEQFL
jgi:hypothetical protein